MAVFTRFPARNSGYNLHIEVFSIGLFMEKSLTAVCDDPMHALRKSLEHMAMCGLWRANVPPPNVPQEHRDYTKLYELTTAGSTRIRISTTESIDVQSSREARP